MIAWILSNARRLTPLQLGLLIAGLALAVAVRLPCLRCTNLDMIIWEIPWYRYIVDYGTYHALVDEYSNYPPAFIYLLMLATHLNAGWVVELTAIKMISIAFDFAAATVAFHLVAFLRPAGIARWVAFFGILLSPTVVTNSSVWGQSDVIYTTFLLGFVYFACKDKPVQAVLCFGGAFCFKLQSMWLAPFLLLLLLNGRVRLRHLFLIPGLYVLLALPQLIAGRAWDSVLLVYMKQATTTHSLAHSIANLYFLMPANLYDLMLPVGLATAALAALALGATGWMVGRRLRPEELLQAALLSAFMMPSLLPKMHDRYFFSADCLAVVLACVFPRYWFAPLVIQAGSLAGYLPFLLGDHPPAFAPLWFTTLFHIHRTDTLLSVLIGLGAIGNWLLLGLLTLSYLRSVFPPRSGTTTAGHARV